MPKNHFAHEAPKVAELLARLGIVPDAPLIDPKAAGEETAADVVIPNGGKGIGVQVTDVESAITLPDVSGRVIRRRGKPRGAEKKLAETPEPKPYFAWVENDPPKAVANIARAIEPKARHRFAGFDERWLLVVAAVAETGAVASSYVLPSSITADALDTATSDMLAKSSYGSAFLMVQLYSKRALFRWDRSSGLWAKFAQPETPPSYSLAELQALAQNPELLNDPESWFEREAKKVLAEMRGDCDVAL